MIPIIISHTGILLAGTPTMPAGPLATVPTSFDLIEAKAEIARHLADLEEALRRPGNPIPVAAASFAILRTCATYASTNCNDELIETIVVATDLLNQSPEAGMGLSCTAQDLVRVVTPFVTHTAALINHAALTTALPTISLALWQSTQQFIERDPDINPFLVSDLGWELARAFEQGASAHCDTIIRILAAEVLTSVSLTAPTCVDQENDLRGGDDPIAPDTGSTALDTAGSPAAASLPIVIHMTARWPTEIVEATLARLRARQIQLSKLLQQQASLQLRREEARVDRRLQDLRNQLDWIQRHNAEVDGDPTILAV